MRPYDFSGLQHRLIKRIEGLEVGSREVHFYMEDGEHYVMSHRYDCCERVTINEIVGDDPKLLCDAAYVARAEVSSEKSTTSDESGTWTFYRLDTSKGCVVIRWLGESNGYYSESVDFDEVIN